MEKKKHPLERYMEKNNLNKKQLAEKCSVSVWKINSHIVGKNIRKAVFILYRISKITEISCDDLLERRSQELNLKK